MVEKVFLDKTQKALTIKEMKKRLVYWAILKS